MKQCLLQLFDGSLFCTPTLLVYSRFYSFCHSTLELVITMASRRSAPSASGSNAKSSSAGPKTPASTAIQASVKQFFSSQAAASSHGSSSSAPAVVPAKNSPSLARPGETYASMSASTPSSPAKGAANAPSTMGRSVAPTRLLRENPVDPIIDSSPHQPALDSVLTASTRSAAGAPPTSPPGQRRTNKRSHGVSKSPKSRSDRSRSKARRSVSATASPARSPGPAVPRGPGRGGRAPIVAPGRGSPSGRSRSTRSSNRSRPSVPPTETTTTADPPPTAGPAMDSTEDQDMDDHPMVIAIANAILGEFDKSRQATTHPSTLSQPSTSSQTPSNGEPVPPPNSSVAAPSHSTSPTRGSFQATLAEEVDALRQQAAATPTDAPAEDDISDDATVAADNAHGHLVHRFVAQPTSVSTASTASMTTTTASSMSSLAPSTTRRPTTQQTNPYYAPFQPRRQVECRYEMRVHVQPSAQADTELRQTLVAFFTKLKESDPSLVIHPWEDKENTTGQSGNRRWKALTSPNQIPATMTGLKKYFPRAIPKTAGGPVYPSVHLGHTVSFAALKEELSWWFQGERHGLWERQLQCEATYVVGWALYSTQSMHVPALRREISERLGIDVGIRWRTIQLDKTGPIPADQLAKALHFEVNKKDKRMAKQRLAEIYAKEATDFPLGIKLRLVWPLSDLMNFRTRTKVAALRLRQLQFCTHMTGMRTWELQAIDIPDERTGCTLRKRLMAIRSQQDGCQLFHSVDPSHIGDAVQFTFHPSREEEARSMVIALPPYLRWKMESENPSFTPEERERYYSKVLYCHFNRDALDRAVDAVWNPTTMTVESPADAYNDWIFDEGDAELDCSTLGDTSGTPASTLPSALAPRVRPHDAAGDTDSISTIPQGRSLASLPSQTSDSSAPPTDNPPSSTPTSSLSQGSPHVSQVQALAAMVDSFCSVMNLLPDNSATQALRQQLANLPASSASSPNDSSPSPSGPASGQGH